jgi:ornithine cyclodeaminase
MHLLYLTARDVEDLLPMRECIERMEEVLRALARGETLQPLRSAHWLPDRRGLIGVMPGALLPGEPAPKEEGEPEAGVLGIKVLTVFPANSTVGLESHQGAVLLFEPEHGRLLAILDASAITAIRTAAVSAVATLLLARDGASDLALLGAGTQAYSHLVAMREVRPVRRVRVWSRRRERAEALAAWATEHYHLDATAVGSPREAVEGADLICTVSAAREPIVAGDWLAPGAHVNAVGACTPATRELDAAAVARARLFTDARESLMNEAGDFLLARQEGAVDDSHLQGELGELLLGRIAGRTSPDEVTLFKSLGLAVEDLASGLHIYRQALARGRGTPLPEETAR